MSTSLRSGDVLSPFAGLRASPVARLVSTGSSRASSRSCVRRAGWSVYCRMAGYEDVNDAERLSQDPTFRLIGSGKIWERLAGLAAIHRELIAKAETIDSPQRVVLDMDSSEGDCLAAKLRPGNLHSADDWEELLLPEGPKGAPRQRKLGKQVVFRADAAFAKPEIYEALEERGVKYAIRSPSNENLEQDIAELQTRELENGAAVGEDRRAFDPARPVLLAASGGEPPDAAVVREHGAPDRRAALADRIERGGGQARVFPCPEEAELARSWAAGVAQDGKDMEEGSHGGGWVYTRGRSGSQDGNPG